jgi:hypothetical protein
MFSASALKAMSAEEAQDELTQQQLNSERTATDAAAAATAAANVAETSTAAAATATVEAASADADLGSVGLPAQHGSAERVTLDAAAPESMDPACDQESVRHTRRSPTRASTPSGAASRAARGGKAAGTSPPATQADLRALALLIAGHTTEIEQLQSTMGAIQATVVGASSDIDDLRAQISSYSDAMTASKDRLIAMMSPLMDETHTTAERLTELDLQV